MKAKIIFVGIIAVSLLLSACAAMGNGTSPETSETSETIPVLMPYETVGSTIPYETAGVVEALEGVEVIQLTIEELNEIYAPVFENNREKLDHIMDYGDEVCSVYVSTSDSFSVHEEVLNEIKSISDSICESYETEHDKVIAMAYWVAENLYYNHVAAESEVNSDTISLETVLETKTATCAGYSNMFSAMCNMQGMYCINLRGGDFIIQDTPEYLLDSPMSHEWTAVIADGEWMYVDTTWLSNNSYTAENGYEKADDFDDEYADMSFEYMSYEHRIDLVDHRDFVSSINALK